MRTFLVLILAALPLAVLVTACGGSPAAPEAAGVSTEKPADEAATQTRSKIAQSAPVGDFVAAGRMTDARLDHTDLLLPDGRVLIVGAVARAQGAATSPTSRAWRQSRSTTRPPRPGTTSPA